MSMKRPLKDARCKNCGNVYQTTRSDTKYCPTCRRAGMHEGKKSLVCPTCGGYKHADSKQCQSCENRKRLQQHGKDHPSWRGGTTRTQGYLLIRQGAGHNAKYVREHRLVWEQTHGAIPKGYVIHHLNGVKDDNRLENLACLPIAAHSGPAIHRAYKARIRQLESQLREFQTSNKLL